MKSGTLVRNGSQAQSRFQTHRHRCKYQRSQRENRAKGVRRIEAGGRSRRVDGSASWIPGPAAAARTSRGRSWPNRAGRSTVPSVAVQRSREAPVPADPGSRTARNRVEKVCPTSRVFPVAGRRSGLRRRAGRKRVGCNQPGLGSAQTGRCRTGARPLRPRGEAKTMAPGVRRSASKHSSLGVESE